MNVITPNKDQSKYQIIVETGGQPYEGYLSYELKRRADSAPRDLVIMRSANIPTFLSALGDVRGKYEAFENLARSIERGSEGRIEAAKVFVNLLADGRLSPEPCHSVAIHRFGPVPIFILPEPFVPRVPETGQPIRIGLYPRYRLTGRVSTEGTSAGVVRDAVLVQSLTIHPALIGRRYFEDIAELFLDIEHHSSEEQAIKNVRLIETRIGESLQTKISAVTNPRNVQDPVHGHIFRGFRAGFADEFFLWQYATAIFQLLIQSFLATSGMARTSKPYRSHLARRIDVLEAEGLDPRNQYIDRGPIVSPLYKLRKCFGRSDAVAQIEILRRANDSRVPEWCRQTLRFAQFVARLRSLGEPTSTGRVFVSDNHHVQVVSQLETVMEPVAKDCGVKIAFFRQGLPGIWLDPEIAVRIWSCDALIAVFPKLGPGRDYRWIFAEMDHALFLNRTLVIVVQEGVDLADLERQMDDPAIPFIVQSSRLKEDRAGRLKEHLRKTLRINFSTQDLADPAALIPQIRQKLQHVAWDHVKSRLRAYSRQWNASQRNRLKRFLFVSQRRAFTARVLQRRAEVPGFSSVWQMVKFKPMMIDSESHCAFIKMQTGNRHPTYREGVTAMIRALAPHAPDEIVREIFFEFCAEL